ncbi:MAG TPA: YceI family protein [Burkholderiaceae bacterium]
MKRLLTIFLASAATLAGAADLIPAQSEIAFTSKQMGVPVDGRFKKFEAQLTLDPKKPEAGQVALKIELGSVSMGSAEVEAELVKPEWFDSKKIGFATFASSAIKAAGPGRFTVTGKLNIKNQIREINVPVTLTQAAGVSTAVGSFTIKRLEFKIGDGEWADPQMVANDVLVKFKLAFKGLAPL